MPVPKVWQENFRQLAAHPNIYMKVSGLMERSTWRSDNGGFPNDRAPEMPGYYRRTLDVLWESFGEDRLIYGSNWPICEHAGDYISHGLRIVRPYFAEKGQQAYDKFFWQNSMKVYKWKPRAASHPGYQLRSHAHAGAMA
jgi:L-fuconolactonase